VGVDRLWRNGGGRQDYLLRPFLLVMSLNGRCTGISGSCSTYGIKDLMGRGYERSARCKAVFTLQPWGGTWF
jgi:hypothetical protein